MEYCMPVYPGYPTRRKNEERVFTYNNIKNHLFMTRKFLKQVAGIDVAQNELVVSLGRMHEDITVEIYAHKTFPNTEKGFMTLVLWVKKLAW